MTWCGGNLKLMEVQKYQRKNEELLGVCSALSLSLFCTRFGCSLFFTLFMFSTFGFWVRISFGIFAVPVILPAEMQKPK